MQASETEFARQVRDALSHLYDPVSLQRHALADDLDIPSGPDRSGEVRQRLLAALESLRPPPTVPEQSRAWRPYRLMQLRYVEARDPVEVQRELGLSKSPYYVEHDKALAAVTAVLAATRSSGEVDVPTGVTASVGGRAREWPRTKILVATGAVVAIAALVAGGVALGVVPGRPGPGLVAPSIPGSSVGEAPNLAVGRVLFQDDFSDPERGLFADRQSGSAEPPNSVGRVNWDYGYDKGGLVGHVSQPSQPIGNASRGTTALANTGPISGNFSFQVKASASQSPAQAEYGLSLVVGPREVRFGVRPEQQIYQLFEPFSPPSLSVTSPFVLAKQPNLLRMEVRGQTLYLLANDHRIRRLDDPAFGVRPASVGLVFFTVGAPADGVVEIDYSDFKVNSLDR